MTPLPLLTRTLRTTTLACLPLLAMAPAAQAGPLMFAPFSGSGNVTVFDPITGDGGWVGSVDLTTDFGLPEPLSLTSFVLFNYDMATKMLSGNFEFTRSADLGATLFGLVTGSSDAPDLLGQGGQLSLDYTIQGGTGDFFGASGYGLSFLQFDPAAAGDDNYTEAGLLAFAVPEPGSLPLLAGALLAMGLLRRRARQVH